MGVREARIRAAQRQQAMGGGLTEPSVSDTATDGDIFEHETGEGPAGMLSSVTLDWDENYGPFGTRSDLPPADALTIAEAREVASEFAQPYLPTATDVRDVGELWEVGTVVLPVGSEAYPIAGADPNRKSIVIVNVSVGAPDIPVGAADVYIGTRKVSNRGGTGAYLLKADFVNVAGGVYLNGDGRITMTHTEEVWVVPASYSGVTPQEVRVTYAIERYTK